ncbi:TPR repeat-containing thioredoxin TTL1 [Zea mays]|uniref:TPR repeat-containing thioredoxin TTL1 n=1 Tax=Zea mays TaxID=4577 RepID=A0A1D6EFR7_MAIZE|nr:TPR repeat-containing thioredoxin TTL1 [Zea mays]
MTPSRSLPSGHRPPRQVQMFNDICLPNLHFQLLAARAEALFHLNLLDEADVAISSASKLNYTSSCSPDTKFCGFIANAYLFYVHAQVDMALGRFDHVVSSIDKARIIDPGKTEVVTMHNKVKSVARARSLGNELFNSGKFSEACIAYGEGLKQHPVNKVLYCNRVACRFKLEQWEKSIEDCNEALKIQPNYTKALLRRAASYGKVAYFVLQPFMFFNPFFLI